METVCMTGIFNRVSELTENIKWIGQEFPARLLLSEGHVWL